ncbi:4546_t:CDS:2 [Entrophospora sp. SA101]|nr:4546_t:CDS:2 [Entrophospora sp. SA101]
MLLFISHFNSWVEPYDNSKFILYGLNTKITKISKTADQSSSGVMENTKRDVRVEELEQKNTELEARLAILEQGVTGVTGQSQNNDIPEITVSVVDVSDSVVENLNNKVGRAVTCDNVPNDNTNNKSSENKEKKLQAQDLNLVTQPCNSATSEASATNIPESSHSDSNEIISQDETGKIRKKTGVEHKKGEGLDKLKHELFVSETSQEPSIEQNLVNEISETLCPGKITFDNISSIDEASQHLAQLCNKAFDAEDKANRANQEEILCWYLYAKDFRIQLNGIIENSEDLKN